MRSKKILLGYEVGTAEPVVMTLHHTIVTGLTQKSGKTTTIEAIIQRSGKRAIAFKTKRGESGFTDYHEIPPFFREKSDWRYVSSVLEAYLRERVKFERRWIMEASKGAKRLRDVYENVLRLRKKARPDSLRESIFMLLEEYLGEILPQIEETEFSKKLDLIDGVNVMDLISLSFEMRSLVIQSVMEHVSTKMRNVVIVVPEAWEYIPQKRGNPVKWYAETFIRKGAAIGNFLLLDSQDVAGIDKTPLRSCDNWIMGRQRETHEVARLRQTVGKKFASEEEIKKLPLGHFFASIGDDLKKVYILPVGVPEEMGRKVALGELSPEDVRDYLMSKKGEDDEEMYRQKYEDLKAEFETLVKTTDVSGDVDGLRLDLETARKTADKLQNVINEIKIDVEKLRKDNAEIHKKNKTQADTIREMRLQHKLFEDLRMILSQMIIIPKEIPPRTLEAKGKVEVEGISVKHEVPYFEVIHELKRIETDTESLLGRIVYIYAKGELGQEWFSQGAVYKLFNQHGWKQNPQTKKVLVDLVNWGYLETRLAGRRPDYRVLLSPDEAKKQGLLTVKEIIT